MSTHTGELVRPRPSRQGWAPVAGVLGIYAATRVLSTLFMMIAGRHQQATAQFASNDPWSYYVFKPLPSDPGLLGLATNWDGQWHHRIATLGYVPATADSAGFAERAWSFPPLYPLTVRAMSSTFDIGVPPAAVVISLVCGALAMVLMFELTKDRLGTWGAYALVALTGCYITAPLYQAAYAEPMALCFLIWTMLDLRNRRYARAFIPLILLALTRLVTPPLAVVAVAHLLVRKRGSDPTTRREVWLLVAYAVVAAVGPLLWSTVAAALSGSADVNRAGVAITASHLGWFDILWSINPWVVLVPMVLSAWFVRLAISERSRLGPELSAWAGAYPVFVLALTPPTPGFFRYFMLAFPLAVGAVGQRDSSTRNRLVGLACVCVITLVLQYLWVRYSFVLDPSPDRPVLNP